MTSANSSARDTEVLLPNRLRSVVWELFPGQRPAMEMFQRFLSTKSYDHELALDLMAVARTSTAGWPLRRVAVLMLENLILKLDPADRVESDRLLSLMGLNRGVPDPSQLDESLLMEGFTSLDPGSFFRELRTRLLRLERIHNRLKGNKTPASALRDFIYISSKDCKLSLARYLWSPAEVSRNVLQQIRPSNAIADPSAFEDKLVELESAHVLSEVPPFERDLFKQLADPGQAFWVSESTSSELNSLVEYPVNTVVLVVKPPASNLEIEIKRAGVRGAQPLSAIYERNGGVVPPSHHLHGGSMGHLLRWETRQGALLSRLYRTVHGVQAPISRVAKISFIYGIPSGDGEVHILNYFSDRNAFGSGFQEMRDEMRRAARALRSSGDWIPPMSDEGIGLSGHFLGQSAPSQALLLGSTSYRLDRTALYLSDSGPEHYFGGRGVPHTKGDARRFADEVLEEALGVIMPSRIPYTGHREYVEAVLALPENRRRADSTYLAMMRQIGTLWGTLMAVRGYSGGESFVSRNVGLKSAWTEGAWTSRLIFMDHDALYIVGKNTDHFHPASALSGMSKDANHIFGMPEGSSWKCEVGCLREIFAVDKKTEACGLDSLRSAILESYDKTLAVVEAQSPSRGIFTGVYIKRLRDWDNFVTAWLDARESPGRQKRVEKRLRKVLEEKGYTKGLIDEYFSAATRHIEFLKNYGFIFAPR